MPRSPPALHIAVAQPGLDHPEKLRADFMLAAIDMRLLRDRAGPGLYCVEAGIVGRLPRGRGLRRDDSRREE